MEHMMTRSIMNKGQMDNGGITLLSLAPMRLSPEISVSRLAPSSLKGMDHMIVKERSMIASRLPDQTSISESFREAAIFD